MARTSVVTLSASGIGKATKEVLESRGEKAIGVDLHDADITVDLTTPDGRAALVDQVTELSGGYIDAIHAIPGLAFPVHATVGVNFFGMVATLEDLRPPLRSASAPRAVAVTSMASLGPLAQDAFRLVRSWHSVARRGTLSPCPTITPSVSRQGHEHASRSSRVAVGCLSGRSPSDTSKRGFGTTHIH